MKTWVQSAGAVAAGFLVTAVASIGMDAAMHAVGIFPKSPQAMSDPLFGLASAYRAAFTVVGGYVVASLTPDRPMRHARILAGIGFAAGLASLAAYFTIAGAKVGPLWYAISIPAEAIPCVMLGAWIVGRNRVSIIQRIAPR